MLDYETEKLLKPENIIKTFLSFYLNFNKNYIILIFKE